ncbi:MAG: Glutamate--cysteine ligase [Gammaproteobacteria bacterium]|nr:Glutamate--cysteine ligase [Gammaproteobacteria bacterium]
MGQEINRVEFSDAHFREFESRLRRETGEFDEWLASDRIEHGGHVFGLEAEAWLVDHNHFPAPHNEALLDRLANPLVVAELSRFNVELNSTPRALERAALCGSEEELRATWRECQRVAHEMGDALVLIGILPTIRNADLCLANMSPLNRYYALNDQLLRRRLGRPVKVDIAGRERLTVTHTDVMLEAATTSFQVHLKVPVEDAVRHYNASLIGSGPVLAASANSPFLFGRSLWEETRVPLFEQAVGVGGEDAASARVTFGSGYLRNSVAEYFHENLERYHILLPTLFERAGRLDHLRLHNGTIWRWNRLLPGFDDAGRAHVRIEHRPLPAGPSIVDMIANAALYVGFTHFLATLREPPEAALPFGEARSNFYAAARLGAGARLRWLGGAVADARSLLLEEALPMARHGLMALGVDAAEAARYLEVVRMRVQTGRNGAAWQRGFVDRHGHDPLRLTAAYLENQRSGAPVHEWEL